jgi:site-specific DNA-methyltransferase (adenine-specific)
MRIKVSDIKIGDRWRKRSLGDLDGLALSINKWGMWHDIVVRALPEGGYELVAGFRRLKAHELLQREEIEVKLKENLNTAEAREIELEENLQRQDLDWQEVVTAKRELDEIKKKIYGSAYISENGWSTEDTATALGESAALTQHDIMLAKALEMMPELRKAKTKTEALKKLYSERKRMARAELMSRFEAKSKEAPQDESVSIICGDSVKVLRDMESESFNLCIADPPFGVGLDSMAQACEVVIAKYKDSEQAMFEKVRIVVKEVSRLLIPNSHFYLFFPIGVNYLWFYNILSENFDYVDPIPINWYKGTGGYTVDQRYRYMPVYQPIFYASKGKRELTKGMKNVIEAEPVRQKVHIAETPAELMEILIEQSSLPGENILDPFCGSGSVLVAAKRLKRRAVGVELLEDNCNIIRERLMEV